MDGLTSALVSGLEARSDDYVCNSDRASDYYGLGVRLGIYFAWLNAYLTHILLPSGIGSAAGANTVFLLTLFIALVKDSMRDHLTQVDGLVLMHLCGGSIFGILSIWGYRTRLYHDHGPKAVGLFGSYGTHIRVFISFAISVYGFWFWGWGVRGGDAGLKPLGPGDGMESGDPNGPECAQLYTFFFAKVKGDGGIRYYYLIICAACSLYFGAMILVSSLTVWFSVERLMGVAGDRWAHAAHVDTVVRPKYATGFSVRELDLMYRVHRIGNPIWLVFSIITVECTLNFNNIQGVLGGNGNDLSKPGQLLPTLVGGFGFVQTLYTILKERVFQGDLHGEPKRGNFGPSVLRSTSEMDKTQQGRATLTRYLVGWLPWLSLLSSYDLELEAQGIARTKTVFNSVPSSPTLSMKPQDSFVRPFPVDEIAGPASPWSPPPTHGDGQSYP